ncbi:MAG: SDR family oxidoreductase, partial [Dehalococcoidia bacterium]
MAVSIDLSGKSAIVFGVANHRSIAWAIAEQLHAAGAHLTVTYQNERLGKNVLDLVKDMDAAQAVECDVMNESSVVAAVDAAASNGPLAAAVHAVAFANKDDLSGDFSATGVEGFRTAMDVSAYSLLPVARAAAAKMTDGGSILTLTFHAAEKVYPGYNVMGVAKAALENEV